MQSYSTTKQNRSISALIFLTLIGVGFLIFSFVGIVCGFIINFHDDFEATDGGRMLEAKVQSQFDYSQYWFGFPLFITAILSMVLGTLQHKIPLSATTLVMYHVCILLAFFVMVLEGTDWVYWKNLDRVRRIWEDKEGYRCSTTAQCICRNTTVSALGEKNISVASCSNISTLSGLYGGIVASAIIGIFLSLSGIVVVLKTISWRKQNNYIRYDVSKAQTTYQEQYITKPYANGTAGSAY